MLNEAGLFGVATTVEKRMLRTDPSHHLLVLSSLLPPHHFPGLQGPPLTAIAPRTLLYSLSSSFTRLQCFSPSQQLLEA
jgi:hypothetical protein